MAWTERYVDAAAAGGGDGTTSATSGANGAWTLAEALANAAAGQRINVKAGSFSRSSTTALTGGTATSWIWWRGYKTTIGDLDTPPAAQWTRGTDTPLITQTSSYLYTTGYCLISAIDVLTSASGQPGIYTGASSETYLHRCFIESSAANAANRAVQGNNSSHIYASQCRLKASSSATDVIQTNNSLGGFRGCIIEGGGIGASISSGGSWSFNNCDFNGVGSHGISFAASVYTLYVNRCLFRGCGGDGIRIGYSRSLLAVEGCAFWLNGGYGINNTSGSDEQIFLADNLFGGGSFANTSGSMANIGDMPSFNEQSSSSDIFNDYANDDLRIVSGATARDAYLPGVWPGLHATQTALLEIGPWGSVPAAGGGGGGLLVGGGMTGGFHRT